MNQLRSWTRAVSLATMRVSTHSSRQGDSHVIITPASLSVCLLWRLRQRPGQTFGHSLALVASVSPLGQRPSHRHLLVPCRRHLRGVPAVLRPPLVRGTALFLRRRMLFHLRRQASHEPGLRRPLAVRPRRFPYETIRPLHPGCWHSPQPHSRTRWREVPLRPCLGHAGLVGPPSLLWRLGPAFAGSALHPRQGRR